MNSIYKDNRIKNIVSEYYDGMSEKRKRHTNNVISTSEKLACLYGADKEKACFASMCHDFFRGNKNAELNDLIHEYNLPDRYIDNPNLAHGKLAAAFLKRIGIDDEEVLNAVSYHTTGRAEMTLLEKIVFIADAIEPDRDYPDVESIRKIAFEDIDKACLLSFKGTIKHLLDGGMELEDIDRDTIEAAEYFESVRKGDINDK